MRISDWSSDVCSSDLKPDYHRAHRACQSWRTVAAGHVRDRELRRRAAFGAACSVRGGHPHREACAGDAGAGQGPLSASRSKDRPGGGRPDGNPRRAFRGREGHYFRAVPHRFRGQPVGNGRAADRWCGAAPGSQAEDLYGKWTDREDRVRQHYTEPRTRRRPALAVHDRALPACRSREGTRVQGGRPGGLPFRPAARRPNGSLHDAGEGTMIARLIPWLVQNRFFVVLGALVSDLAGLWALRTTPTEARKHLPD